MDRLDRHARNGITGAARQAAKIRQQVAGSALKHGVGLALRATVGGLIVYAAISPADTAHNDTVYLPDGTLNPIAAEMGVTGSPTGWDPDENDPYGDKLKAQLRLEQRLSQGKIHTAGGSLEIGGASRAAVFDVRTQSLYVGRTNHIGVVNSHGLPVETGRYVGGFVRVAQDRTIRFTHGSGTFPGVQVNNLIGQSVDDLIRGIGVRVSNPL